MAVGELTWVAAWTYENGILKVYEFRVHGDLNLVFFFVLSTSKLDY